VSVLQAVEFAEEFRPCKLKKLAKICKDGMGAADKLRADFIREDTWRGGRVVECT
jgi:hypothetical protein